MGDVFTARQDVGQADIRFASGYFCAQAEGADHSAPGLSGDLIAVQAFEGCLGEDDVCEGRLKYVDAQTCRLLGVPLHSPHFHTT